MNNDFNEFTNALTRITSGGSVEDLYNKLNTPLSQIETCLNTLASRISGINSNSAIVRNDVHLASNVVAGDLVYYNVETAQFERALAMVSPEPGIRGETIEAACARVEGMVVSINDNGLGSLNNITGTLLIGGYWKSMQLVEHCIEDQYKSPGIYYLSAINEGRATASLNGRLRQPVFSYYGDGAFSLQLFYKAQDNHYHMVKELENYWEPASNAPSDAEAPAGAVYWYNASNDPDFFEIGTLDSSTSAIFYNGILQAPDGPFRIVDGNLWYTGNALDINSRIVIFNQVPFTYGAAMVRTVESTNNLLAVQNKGGRVILTSRPFEKGATKTSPIAVAGLSDGSITYTPVITSVKGVAGINVTTDMFGGVTIASNALIGSLRDAYSINHNQTNLTSDGRFIYITYPKGRQASLTMTLPVTDMDPSREMKALVWCQGVGAGASFDIAYSWTPESAQEGAVDLPQADAPSDVLTFSSSANKAIYAESTTGQVFSGNGLITATVSISARPGTDIRMLRIGFKLIVNKAAASNNLVEIEQINAVSNTAVCAAGVTKFKCLKPTNNGLAVCTSADAGSADMCVGVSIEDAMYDETKELYTIRYMIQGVIQSNDFDFVPGQSIWMDVDGTLTSVNPRNIDSAAYVQRIGRAISQTAVQISVEPAYVKEA